MALTLYTMELPGVISGMRMLRVGDALWRVVDREGRAVGHLTVRTDVRGRRFVARRFQVSSRTFRDIGEFWTPREAVDCLRLSR